MSDENSMNAEESRDGSFGYGETRGENFSLAVIGGLVASLVGAAVWAVVTIVTNYQIGWMAIGVGFLTGFTVNFLGKGTQPLFGVIGAVFALLGCFLGNFFAMVHFGAADAGMGFFELLFSLDVSTVVDVMVTAFEPMDALFYGLALYTGFKYSFQ